MRKKADLLWELDIKMRNMFNCLDHPISTGNKLGSFTTNRSKGKTFQSFISEGKKDHKTDPKSTVLSNATETAPFWTGSGFRGLFYSGLQATVVVKWEGMQCFGKSNLRPVFVFPALFCNQEAGSKEAQLNSFPLVSQQQSQILTSKQKPFIFQLRQGH